MPHPTDSSDLPLIPRAVLFGNPERTSAQISPDGRYLSWLAPREGVMNVWVAPAASPDEARAVTRETERGVMMYGWAYTGRHLFYLQDQGGNENFHLFLVDLDSDDVRDLTPLDDVRATVQHVSHEQPGSILIGLNDRDERYHDLYRVELADGERTLVQQNDGWLGFLTDDDYAVRFAMKPRDDGGTDVFRKIGDDTDSDSFEPYDSIPMADSLTTDPVGFDADGRHLYMLDSRGRDTAALTRVDVETREQAVLATDDRADITGVLKHPTQKRPLAVAATYDRRAWQVLDDEVRDDFEALRRICEGDFAITDQTLDNRRWVVAYTRADGPVAYYLYDRDTRQAEFLFVNRRELEDLPLADMQPVVIPARDGLDLVCYLTLPPGIEDRPEQPLPAMLWIHGGPWARDTWGYNPVHQWLANRGYAVISVNYRGSTGFGKAFINAANLEWAGKMHDDLIDVVDWLVEQGIADRERIAIGGGSYGGYATLTGLTFTPDVFACGVDLVGPSNLRTLLSTIPPYWEPFRNLWKTRVGDIDTDEGRAFLDSRSPLSRVDAIGRPLLIGQGANDPRVKQSESDQIVEAMQAKGIPVTYLLYGDEGHGFNRPENRLSFFAVTEAFLAQHLGGRHEPIGDAFEHSSIEVVAGAEGVPELDAG